MTDKMREAFEKWYMTNTFAHVDHLSVFYNDLNCYSTPIANHCWKAWQAAQAVPVVGEPVAWLVDKPLRHVNMSKSTPIGLGNATQEPLYRAPTHSITAAELERMRKDAERYRWLSYNASYSIHEMLFGKPAFVATHKESDLAECIDAAIAAEVE